MKMFTYSLKTSPLKILYLLAELYHVALHYHSYCDSHKRYNRHLFNSLYVPKCTQKLFKCTVQHWEGSNLITIIMGSVFYHKLSPEQMENRCRYKKQVSATFTITVYSSSEPDLTSTRDIRSITDLESEV